VGRCAGVFVLCLGIVSMIGCGGGSNSSTTQQLRIVMASPDAPPVDILIDGTQVATALVYTNSTAYLAVKSGGRQVQVLTVSNSTSIFKQPVSVTASANETLLLTGPASKMQSLLLTDGATTTTTTTTATGQVRAVNASPPMGPADVYIVNAGSSIAGTTPAAAKLAFDQATSYKSEAIGNYQVFMTQPGTTNVFFDTGPLELTQSQFQTVVALDAIGGGFNFISLTDQ
jgi:Domain of unknown function (DUF4397)